MLLILFFFFSFLLQIAKLPGPQFWAGLSDLQILYLHDNSISKLEYVQFMASSPSVAVLTLFNTPLSLKANYRHHVVNSLWSLKALDHYVVSDEEIIEDASFGGRFTPMCPNFNIDTYCTLKKVEYVNRLGLLKGVGLD